MSLNFKSLRKFREIKKKYAYDLELNKKILGQQSDSEVFETLLMHDLSVKVANSLEEYYNNLEELGLSENLRCGMGLSTISVLCAVNLKNAGMTDGDREKIIDTFVNRFLGYFEDE